MFKSLKLILAVVSSAGVAAVLAPGALANGAVTQPLLANTVGDCIQGANPNAQTLGKSFVTLKQVGGTISATIKLQGAAPNGTWDVAIVQTPSGESCLGAEGTITTNAQGSGNASLSEPLLTGTTGAFVTLVPTNAAASADGIVADTGVTF